MPARPEKLPWFDAANGNRVRSAHALSPLECELECPLELDPCEKIVVRAFTQGWIEALLDAGKLADAFSALPLLSRPRRGR